MFQQTKEQLRFTTLRIAGVAFPLNSKTTKVAEQGGVFYDRRLAQFATVFTAALGGRRLMLAYLSKLTKMQLLT
jgi:hypothetical protein